MIYTNTFGGSTIYPSDVSYVAITLDSSTSVQLSWPLENAGGTPAARIIDADSSGNPRSVTMPDATRVSVGQTHLFNNVGSAAFTVYAFDGSTIASVGSGEQWQIYLADTATAAGTWQVFRFGAASAYAQASSLAAGNLGLQAFGSALVASENVIPRASPGLLVGATHRGKLIMWTSTGGGSISLSAVTLLGDGFFVDIRNAGGGVLHIDANGSETINGAPTLDLQPGDSARFVCDGSDWYTVGLGKDAVFAFDYTAISLAGAPATYTMAGGELNRVAYKFVGALANNVRVVVPDTIQQYWVDNDTTGPFTLTVGTALGGGVNIPAGTRAILYSDGTNVVNAATAGLAVPIGVTSGGTGFSAYTIGDILAADSATTFARIADAAVGKVLISGGVGVLPAWGVASVPAGGTGVSALSAGRFLYGAGTAAMVQSTFLQENANGVGVGRAAGAGFTVDVGAASGTLSARLLNDGTTSADRVALQLRTSTTGVTASTCGISLGDGDSATAGRMLYDHGTDTFYFRTADTERATLGSSGLLMISGPLGYTTGAGGTVAQATSRTTGVTLNTFTGAVTLFSAAGSTAWQTFTVTNSAVAASDHIIVNQKTGTDKYMIHVTRVAAGAFDITFATTGGTTVEAPVFSFGVIKGVTT